MINDDTFRRELDATLKKMKIKKAERNEIIMDELMQPIDMRDAILDDYEKKVAAPEKVPLESYEQKKVVEWWRQNYPDHPILMVRNDGYRTITERTQQILMGLHPGVSDLYIPWLKCWVEMKRIKGSVWGDEQKAFSEYVKSIGDEYLLCYGHEWAINSISMLIKNKLTNTI